MESARGQSPGVHSRFVRQHRPARRAELAARAVHRADPGGQQGLRSHADTDRRRTSLADDVQRLQALQTGQLPRGLPHERPHAHRVRHRLHPERCLQRLPQLHLRVPVRRHRVQRGEGHRPEMHALLRPAAERDAARVRQSLPNGVDPLRVPRRAAEGCRLASRSAADGWLQGRAALRSRRHRLRRAERVLPLDGQAGRRTRFRTPRTRSCRATTTCLAISVVPSPRWRG